MSPLGSILDDPEHWRGRAEAVAEQMTDTTSKAMMLRIADDYDRIAEHAQQRALSAAKR